MVSILALMLCAALVTALLYIERKRNPYASLALWIPTLWMLIYASRPIGTWFQIAAANIEEGSALDRWILSILIALALVTLRRRQFDWSGIFRDNRWLVVLFLYAGISIFWSEIPFVSFKRWIRSTGDIFVALVVLSEQMPYRALESIFRRCAYVLIPLSVVLIKYFPELGVNYGRWSGELTWIGVGSQKNVLGQLCALSAFFLTWSLLKEWRSGTFMRIKSQTLSDVLVLGMTVFLLGGPSANAYSATSVTISFLGVTTLLVLSNREHLAKNMTMYLRTCVVILALGYILFFDLLMAHFAPALGREETLTGRTDIWRPLLAFASHNPLFGVGYGGFWAPGNAELVQYFTPSFVLAQAHNGYLAIYVELGIVGIMLFIAFVTSFCGRTLRQMDHLFDWGVYGICLLLMTLLYNNTEVALLRSGSYVWSTLVFLTIVFTSPLLHEKQKD